MKLSRISLFERLNSEEQTRLAAICKRRVFAADTVVFFEGDQSDSLYVILSGAIKVYTTDDDGQQKLLSTLGAGEVFGEYSLIDGHPRSAAVATLEETEVLCLSHIDFRQFVAKAPDVLWKVLESLTGRMRRQTSEMMELAFRDVPYRLLRVLVRLTEKHGRETAEGVAIKLTLSAATLASMVGSSPERVGRLLHRFQVEGLVRHSDAEHLLIPDFEALKRALEYTTDWS